MSYPILLIFGMIACVTALMVKVIPMLVGMFGDKSKLPPATQMIINTSDFFKANWFIVLVVGAIAFVVLKLWKNTKEGKYRWDAFLLKLPGFGELIRKVALSRFARIFSNLISSGVSVVEAIRIVASAV